MTAQIHEKLIIDGQEFRMAFCPPLPKGSSDIAKVGYRTLRQDIKDQKLPNIVCSSACWRGYVGTWEIKDGKLYLNEIIGRYKKISDQPLFANWFSGVLRIPSGKLMQPIHMGFGTVYEKELHIKIEEGVVIKEREIDNSSKDINKRKLSHNNLPGSENRFEGDDT